MKPRIYILQEDIDLLFIMQIWKKPYYYGRYRFTNIRWIRGKTDTGFGYYQYYRTRRKSWVLFISGRCRLCLREHGKTGLPQLARKVNGMEAQGNILRH